MKFPRGTLLVGVNPCPLSAAMTDWESFFALNSRTFSFLVLCWPWPWGIEDDLSTGLDRWRIYKLTHEAGSWTGRRGHQLCLFVLIKNKNKKQKTNPARTETGEKYRENSIIVPCAFLVFLGCSKYPLNTDSNISRSKLQTGQTLLPSYERRGKAGQRVARASVGTQNLTAVEQPAELTAGPSSLPSGAFLPHHSVIHPLTTGLLWGLFPISEPSLTALSTPCSPAPQKPPCLGLSDFLLSLSPGTLFISGLPLLGCSVGKYCIGVSPIPIEPKVGAE